MRILAVVVIAACHSAPPAALPSNATSAPTVSSKARQFYADMCSMCHGVAGRGDGSATATLSVQPQNYQLSAWQASVTDEELRTIIVRGGQGVGKSAMMPGNPQLADQPVLLYDLVRLIRSFANP